jgi:hypothetical protein
MILFVKRGYRIQIKRISLILCFRVGYLEIDAAFAHINFLFDSTNRLNSTMEKIGLRIIGFYDHFAPGYIQQRPNLGFNEISRIQQISYTFFFEKIRDKYKTTFFLLRI